MSCISHPVDFIDFIEIKLSDLQANNNSFLDIFNFDFTLGALDLNSVLITQFFLKKFSKKCKQFDLKLIFLYWNSNFRGDNKKNNFRGASKFFWVGGFRFFGLSFRIMTVLVFKK